MDQLDILRIQARRKASELHDAIALEPSGRVVAVFKNDAYGVFAVDGDVARGTSFFVGGMELGNNGKAARELVLLRAEEGVGEASGEPVPAEALPGAIAAGDVVAAHFDQHPYGAFTITGVAVTSPRSDDLLVGSWFITVDGIASPRLVSVDVLARAAEHDIPAPLAMSSWAGGTDGTVDAQA